VISPQPHDGHPTHEAVGRAVREALEQLPAVPVWWMWGLWADLAVPTLYAPYGEAELERALHVLAAYAGELERNDYRRVVSGRASSSTVLGSERIFGFGSAAASDEPYAELLTEAVRRDGHWYAGARRVLDLAEPLGDGSSSNQLLEDWLSDRWR
jgi:LmbE family N-acetylglucosaminyl deacetylase